MDKKLLIAALAAPLLTACVIHPHHGYSEVVLEPGLPRVVTIGPSPYYNYGGYVYYHHNDRWAYSRSHAGPWSALPRHLYPHEVHHHNRGDGRRAHDRGHRRHRH